MVVLCCSLSLKPQVLNKAPNKVGPKPNGLPIPRSNGLAYTGPNKTQIRIPSWNTPEIGQSPEYPTWNFQGHPFGQCLPHRSGDARAQPLPPAQVHSLGLTMKSCTRQWRRLQLGRASNHQWCKSHGQGKNSKTALPMHSTCARRSASADVL